jgi:fibronectin type 3 domain-containing protein
MDRRVLAVLGILVAIFGIVAGSVLLGSRGQSSPVVHKVTLSWRAPASEPNRNALRYKVYRSEDSGQSYQPIAKSIVGTTYEDPDVVAGKNYLYQVTTVNPQGLESVRTPPVSVTVPE